MIVNFMLNSKRDMSTPKSKASANPSNPKTSSGGASRKARKRRQQSMRPRFANETSDLALRHTQEVNFMTPTQFSVQKGTTPGGVRCRGREMLFTVVQGASAAFNVQGVNLTPLSLPRLASMAGIWEEYFFHNSRVMFQPILATTTNGLVSTWFDLDAGDVPEINQSQASRNICYSAANAYAVMSCDCPGSLARLKRFFCTSGLASNVLQTLQAQVRVATEGIPLTAVPAGATVGFLYLHYDIEFYTPN